MAYASLASPFGDITVFAEDGAVVALEWGRAEPAGPTELPEPTGRTGPGAALAAAIAALGRYFAGEREAFDDLVVRPRGSDFQRRVWARLRAIPFGTVVSYGALAAEFATAPRAVAGACARNPIAIVIPCHRVVGANGALTGYSGGGGVETKAALLALEGWSPAPRRV